MLTYIRYKKKMEEETPDIDLDLDDMTVAKHVAKAVGLATPGRLDKEEGMATVKTVRAKMRRLFSQWERKTNRKIPPEIHDSMASVRTPAGLPIYILADNIFANKEESILKTSLGPRLVYLY